MPDKTFEDLLQQKNKISAEELDEFFASLEPVKIGEMIGKWRGGYFPTGETWLELFLRDFLICKWYGKTFVAKNKVKALVFSFLGMKFNMPFFGAAVLREIEFSGKISAAMIYSYLPIIDNFRKADDKTVMGIMEIKGKTGVYFYLQKFNL